MKIAKSELSGSISIGSTYMDLGCNTSCCLKLFCLLTADVSWYRRRRTALLCLLLGDYLKCILIQQKGNSKWNCFQLFIQCEKFTNNKFFQSLCLVHKYWTPWYQIAWTLAVDERVSTTLILRALQTKIILLREICWKESNVGNYFFL